MKYPVTIVEPYLIQVRITASIRVSARRGTYDGAEWDQSYIEIGEETIIETFEVDGFVAKMQHAKLVCKALDMAIVLNWRNVGFPENFPESIEV